MLLVVIYVDLNLLSPTSVAAESASANVLHSLGTIDMNIELGNVNVGDIKFTVLDNLNTEVIIGNDVLPEMFNGIDFSTNCLSYKDHLITLNQNCDDGKGILYKGGTSSTSVFEIYSVNRIGSSPFGARDDAVDSAIGDGSVAFVHAVDDGANGNEVECKDEGDCIDDLPIDNSFVKVIDEEINGINIATTIARPIRYTSVLNVNATQLINKSLTNHCQKGNEIESKSNIGQAKQKEKTKVSMSITDETGLSDTDFTFNAAKDTWTPKYKVRWKGFTAG